jgi:hypothetical protein
MSRRIKLGLIAAGFILYAIFHHNYWWWDSVQPVLFGWMPLTLWLHILLVLLCIPYHWLSAGVLLKELPQDLFENND